jgi:hypothetical protein
MMKTILIILFFTISHSFAGQCPELAGSYHCVISQDQYSLLVITQRILSQPAEAELVSYTFDYKAIPGGEDTILAGSSPQSDNMGWFSKCTQNRLQSISYDGSMMSELYLNGDQALIRSLNGRVVQQCPHKI